jgi:hypothetical protein
MKKTAFNLISSLYIILATIVYTLVWATFLEFDPVSGEKENNLCGDKDNDRTKYTQQAIETQYKSPCLPSAEMCITICA